MPEPYPIVLIEIDENSRLRIRQTNGVRIGFIDFRVERDALTILPECDQTAEIMAAIDALKLISQKNDDAVGTAVATLQRISAGRMIVAMGPGR